MTKAEVTALITAMQAGHKEAVTAALAPVHAEVTRLDGLHKEADKKAKKADALEAELTTTKATYERHTTLSELLGVTDPADIADIAAIHSSRTAGQEKPLALRDWVSSHIADPEKAPSTLRPYLEHAPKPQANADAKPAGGGATRREVNTGGGRVQAPAGGQRMTVDSIMQAGRSGTSASDLIRTFRQERGLPVAPKVDVVKKAE